MKAFVYEKYGSPDVLELREVEKPIPGDDEVLIKIKTAAVNDWDWGLVTGKPFVMRMINGLFKPRRKIPGVEIAGEVEAVGNDIKNFQSGDEVYGDISECGFGGFAEYVCVPEKALAKKPAGMTFIEAAAIPHAAMLAVQGLIDIGQIQNGKKVLINGGGGGVGTIGVQIAKLYDVEVTGVDSAGKLDMMLSMGFDQVMDYKKEDFTKNGQKYDLILDAKTNRSMFDYAGSLSLNGIYITIGGSMNRILQAVTLGSLISMFSKKKIKVLGLKPNKDLDYMNELFEKGKIKLVIDGPYKLNEVPQAISLFGAGDHKGKIIITI